MNATLPIRKTVNRWSEIFGIEIVDNDGFDSLTKEVTFDEFIDGFCVSTIVPVNGPRYSILNELVTK